MGKGKELRVRVFPNASQERSDWRGQARIVVNYNNIADLKLKDGGRCLVSSFKENSSPREAIISASPESLNKGVVQISQVFRELLGVTPKDSVVVMAPERGDLEVPLAQSIIVRDVTEDNISKNLSTDDRQKFIKALKEDLTAGFLAAEFVLPSMSLAVPVPAFGKRFFQAILVNDRRDSIARFDAISTKVTMLSGSESEPQIGKLKISSIVGQEESVAELNRLFSQLGSPKTMWKNLPRSCAVVLDGPLGSLHEEVVDKIVESEWGTVYEIAPGDQISSLKEAFAQARKNQPSIVLLRHFKPESRALIHATCSALDILSADERSLGYLPQVLVLAMCKDYVADIPLELRSTTRFVNVVTLRVPDEDGRRRILQYIGLKMQPEEAQDILDYIVENTIGWTPGDIRRLVLEAFKIENEQCEKGQATEYFTMGHFEQARRHVRPATMDGIDNRPPKVKWDDIGGNDELKRSLSHYVRLMTNPSPLVGPPRGLLLYGPPGCSKTMTAQAMATTARCNFFSVKGGELLNMYVGESERNVRQLFERARRAAPSIIFFDELDAIGGGRSSMSSSAYGGGDSGGGTKIIQALLTEIDGFDSRPGVMVVGATNRPDLIDSALLRPGRIDQIHYIAPPDASARKAILSKLIDSKKDYTAGLVDAVHYWMFPSGSQRCKKVNLQSCT